MRKFLLSVVIAIVASLAMQSYSAIVEPVQWAFAVDTIGGDKLQVVITGHIEPGWHVYTNEVAPDAGPTPLSVTYGDGITPSGPLTSDVESHREFDPMFEAEVMWWSGDFTLRQDVEATAGAAIAGELKYAACNDQNCIPPATVPFIIGQPADVQKVAADTHVGPMGDIWSPVDIVANNGDDTTMPTNIWYIFLACFAGGFVALLTPCVWPMIPLTVSFFLKKSGSRSKSIIDALTYGVSIIVIYVTLGVIVTAIFGANKLNEIATSAICNIIFFALLVVFAISFFGAFELRLPSRWADKMDSSAEKTSGLLSIFFMAFTLAIVSFSCTGPIIGTLLVEAASTGSKLGPAIGMLGFSLALAIPFGLFAMFPSLLKSVPKSGGWMNTVKVVLGFLELALSLKFLSVADLAYGWHILDREVFLVLWIVVFGMLGIYLLGGFAFAHYGHDSKSGISVFRFFLAMISLSFSVYLIPGLWGAPLKAVSAFVPPLYTQDFNLGGTHIEEYDDFEAGMAAACREGKPVFVDFSGYGCVNCRKMESAVLADDEVKTMLDNNFVVITLMVDSRKPLPKPIEVEENGKTITLDTYGEKWSYLQRYKFKSNAQPYYVVLDPDGQLLSGPVAYDENISKFIQFLENGLDAVN